MFGFFVRKTSMKKIIFLLILFILFAFDTQSQTTPYKIKVVNNEKENTKGILYNVTDSTLVLISELDYYRFKNKLDFTKTTISFSQIDKIKISKKKHFWRSFGITTFAGAFIGAISGYSAGDDKTGYVGFSAKEKAIFGGIGGTISGALIGTTIGLIQINIPINKKYTTFCQRKDYLTKRALLN